MKIEKRMAEIAERKIEIRSQLEGNEDVNLDEVKAELDSLEVEERGLKDKLSIAQSINEGQIEVRQIEKPKMEERKMVEFQIDNIVDAPEFRSAFLKNLQGKSLTEVEQRALTTAANSAGAAVPTQTLNTIVDKMRQVSVLFPLVRVSYIPGNVSIVVANAKNAAAWKTEGADGTAADDTVTSVSLAGYELIKLVEISAAASAMTVDAFEVYIAEEVGRQLGIALENAILNGTGSGQPTGILSGITWAAGTNMINYTTALTISYDNLLDTVALLPTLYHQNAVFVMSRKTLFSGIRKIKSTTNEPIFTLDSTQGFAGSIFGFKVIIDDYIADDVILFGDLSYFYLNFALSPTIETSIEAGFRSGKKVYRGLAVLDGKPALAEAFVKLSKTGL